MNASIYTAYLLLPEIIVFGMILVILLTGAFQVKPEVMISPAGATLSFAQPSLISKIALSPNLGYYLSLITLILVIFAVIEPYLTFVGQFPFLHFVSPRQNIIIMDSVMRSGVSDLFKLFILLTSLIALTTAKEFMHSFNYLCNEYWVIFLICLLGMLVVVSAINLLVIYVGLEVMALSFYAMIALNKKNTNSVMAAMKYFVLGSLASGIFLFGFSLIYGALGTFNLIEIMQETQKIIELLTQGVIPNSTAEEFALFIEKTHLLLGVGLVFVVIALAFKLGAVPFHLWVADVYDGAHTPIITLIASSSKIVAVAVVFRLLVMGFYPLYEDWKILVLFLAVGSIALGNIAAISQESIKRMLAYSSIAHAGYMLLGFASGTPDSIGAAIFYIFSYALTGALAFGLLSSISHSKEQFDTINSLKGLHTRKPILALILMILMFSMAGIPPFLGFYAKLGVIQPLVLSGFLAIAIFAVVFSVVGAYYYLRVVKVMYFDAPERTNPIQKNSLESLALLMFGATMVVWFGIYPDSLLSITRYALFLEQMLPISLFQF